MLLPVWSPRCKLPFPFPLYKQGLLPRIAQPTNWIGPAALLNKRMSNAERFSFYRTELGDLCYCGGMSTKTTRNWKLLVLVTSWAEHRKRNQIPAHGNFGQRLGTSPPQKSWISNPCCVLVGCGCRPVPAQAFKAVVSGPDFPEQQLEGCLLNEDDVNTRGGYKGSSASPQDEWGQYWGPDDGEVDEPICSGRKFPSLAFVSPYTLVRRAAYSCALNSLKTAQSPWHLLKTKSDRSGCKSNNTSTVQKDWNVTRNLLSRQPLAIHAQAWAGGQ